MIYWIDLCFWFAVGQATAVLMLALIVAQLYRRTPERSHFLLICGIVLSTTIPILSAFIAAYNYGWIAPNQLSTLLRLFFVPFFAQTGILRVLFLIGTVCFVLLFIYGIFASRQLIFRAKPLPDRELHEALLKNAAVLQNMSLPILFTSDDVKTPTVWCWGLHPAILLPEQFLSCLTAKEHDAIFLHELAHIARRDHLTAFIATICGIFLFWHPLYWIALRQSNLLADEACDLLVLSCGSISPDQYMETLLRFVAGETYQPPIFQFLSRKDRIMKRINTILDFSEGNAHHSVTGRFFWKSTVLTASLLLAVTLAFCQERQTPETPKKNVSENNVPKNNVAENSVSENKTNTEKISPSLLPLLQIDGLKAYSVDKTVADFPDEINLTTPENAHVTLKHLIISKRNDKYEQLSQMTYGNPTIPDREKTNDRQLTDEWREIFKKQNVIFEMLTVQDTLAFVWGIRQFDNLYDGNLYVKKDNKWLNCGNLQNKTLKGFAETLQSAFFKLAKQFNVQIGWTTPGNIQHTHLCIFEPVGDFKPRTPTELLNKLNTHLQQAEMIMTGYFRTWIKDGKLIGGICTDNEVGLRNLFASIPELKLISMERLNAESFDKHSAKKQESLPSENH